MRLGIGIAAEEDVGVLSCAGGEFRARGTFLPAASTRPSSQAQRCASVQAMENHTKYFAFDNMPLQVLHACPTVLDIECPKLCMTCLLKEQPMNVVTDRTRLHPAAFSPIAESPEAGSATPESLPAPTPAKSAAPTPAKLGAVATAKAGTFAIVEPAPAKRGTHCPGNHCQNSKDWPRCTA